MELIVMYWYHRLMKFYLLHKIKKAVALNKI